MLQTQYAGLSEAPARSEGSESAVLDVDSAEFLGECAAAQEFGEERPVRIGDGRNRRRGLTRSGLVARGGYCFHVVSLPRLHRLDCDVQRIRHAAHQSNF